MKGLTVGLSIAGIGMMAGLFLQELSTDGEFAGVVVALGALGGLLVVLFVETFGVLHRFDADGLQKGSPWSRRIYLPWRDVESIHYSAALRWYVIRGLSGTIRVSEFLDGIEDFERVARDRVPPNRWRGGMARMRPSTARNARR